MLTSQVFAFLDDLGAFESAARKLAAHRSLGRSPTERYYCRIQVGQGLMDNYIRPGLDRFLIDNPEIVPEFDTQLPSNRTGSDVESAGFDFALLHLREDYPMRPNFRHLARVRGGIYGHRDVAAGRALPLEPAYLSGLPFILPYAGSPQASGGHNALQGAGIFPRNVVCYTPFYDVMARMLGKGVGISAFFEVVLPITTRECVMQLYPLNCWKLIFFRRSGCEDKKTVISWRTSSFHLFCTIRSIQL